MLVQGKHFTTIWLSDDKKSIEIIDQRFLPFEFQTETLKTVNDIFIAIKDMHLRGAPLIGVAGAFGVYIACLEANEIDDFEKFIFQSVEKLKSSRPTAINLFYAIDKVLVAISDVSSIDEKINIALETAIQIRNDEIENCRKIGEFGFSLIEEISKKKNGETINILTHCNAGWLACVDYGTATAPIYHAYDKGIKVHVWVDETRPRNQGAKLTAWELDQHGVPHTIIADNTGGHLMQNGMVDIVIVGSDRTALNGDVANKIGTYLKALAAFDNKIPFYVALPTTTIDTKIKNGLKEIPIVIRDEDEVKYVEGYQNGKIIKTLVSNENSAALNYGFDVTPARLVTGLITEKGICLADKESIQKIIY
ncbi:MAG: S-methyl-5-thioribose-1-phosphate isomerase [Saprospiraceae bacterium]|nr:S-methyl-5-thioribose-1-phosphate isomerase [Saprospiraceae bacterium]